MVSYGGLTVFRALFLVCERKKKMRTQYPCRVYYTLVKGNIFKRIRVPFTYKQQSLGICSGINIYCSKQILEQWFLKFLNLLKAILSLRKVYLHTRTVPSLYYVLNKYCFFKLKYN